MDQFAKELRDRTSAMRLNLSKFGMTRALSGSQRSTAAEPFSADSDLLMAQKKLIDSKDKRVKAVTGIMNNARKVWVINTVPYPEPGFRLINKDRIELVDGMLTKLVEDLAHAKAELQSQYASVVGNSREQLGDLFDESDYPEDIASEYDINWDYPAVEPPEYLKTLHPKIYKKQQEIIAAKFQEAVTLTEQAFADEFSEMVANLADRLQGGEDGKPKRFRAASVDNLKDFFDRFKSMSINSSEELNQLVEDAKNAVEGVTATELRANQSMRTTVSDSLNKINNSLSQMMVAQQTRSITFET